MVGMEEKLVVVGCIMELKMTRGFPNQSANRDANERTISSAEWPGRLNLHSP